MPMQPKLIGFFTFLSFLAGILMIVVGVPTLAFFGKSTAAGLFLLAGIVAVLVGRLHLVEELTLGPLKARLRASIEEATATLQQLRTLALSLAEASLTDLMAGNFFDNMSLRQRLAMHDVIIKSLYDLGLSPTEVQKASANWNKGIGVTYHRAIRSALPQNLDRATKDGFDSFLEFKEWKTATPDEVERFLKEHDLLTPQIADWVADYRHFEETKEIRRIEEFVKQ